MTFRFRPGPERGIVQPAGVVLLGARDGSIWLGTPLGLGRWHNGQITRFGRDGGLLNGLGPHSLFEDHRGRIWVSTSRDFGYLQNDRFIPIGAVPGGYVLSIAEDTARDIWIVNRQRGLIRLRDEAVEQIPGRRRAYRPRYGGDRGPPARRHLAWFRPRRGRVLLWGPAQCRALGRRWPGAGQILDFRFSADGALWAATQGGLSRLKGGSIGTLSSKNGLPCDTVHWSMEDDDRRCGCTRPAVSCASLAQRSTPGPRPRRKTNTRRSPFSSPCSTALTASEAIWCSTGRNRA